MESAEAGISKYTFTIGAEAYLSAENVGVTLQERR